MADLVCTVWVRNPDNKMVAFGPGDDIPGWAKKQMGPHCFVDGGDTTPEPEPEPEGNGNGGESTEEQVNYSKWKKAELQDEIDRRNEGRDDDHLIEVGGKGNVPDLVAALEADDAAAAASGGDGE